MNRRTFLQMMAAAAALPIAPKIKLTPGPKRLEYDGFVFIEDPNPLRFVLTPMPQQCFGLLDDVIKQVAENATFEPNPAWVSASHECLPENGMFPTPRRRGSIFPPLDPTGGPLVAAYDVLRRMKEDMPKAFLPVEKESSI